MIQDLVSDDLVNLSAQDIAICQRVLDNACIAQRLTDLVRRSNVAASIVLAYKHGLKDEASLNFMFV